MADVDVDGTQDPSPYREFADPAVGGDFVAPATGVGGSTAPQIAEPVRPDSDAVRKLVDEMSGETQYSGAESTSPAIPPQNVSDEKSADEQSEPLGMLPQTQRRSWPIRPNRARRGLTTRRTKPSGPTPGDDDQQIVAVRRSRERMSNSSLGVAIAIVLLVVFGIVALQFVISLVDSIRSLFD